MKTKICAASLASIIVGLAATAFAAGPGGGGMGGGGTGSGMSGTGPMAGQRTGPAQGQTQMDQVRQRQLDRQQIEQRVRKYPDIYGVQLMTDREVSRYREQLRTATTEQERNQIQQRHKSRMDTRAKQMGVKVTTSADLDRTRDQTRDQLQTPDQDRDQTRDRDRDQK